MPSIEQIYAVFGYPDRLMEAKPTPDASTSARSTSLRLDPFPSLIVLLLRTIVASTRHGTSLFSLFCLNASIQQIRRAQIEYGYLSACRPSYPHGGGSLRVPMQISPVI